MLVKRWLKLFTTISQGSKGNFTLPTKHPLRSEGCFVDKIGRGNPLLRKFFNFPKK